jgi:hypothetical protein
VSYNWKSGNERDSKMKKGKEYFKLSSRLSRDSNVSSILRYEYYEQSS